MDDRGGFDSQRRSFVPVKVGDELDVIIEAVGEKGDGIAKREGFVLFVPNTNQGDKVKIKVTRVLRRVGFAEVVGSASSESSDEDAADETLSEDDSKADKSADDTSESPEDKTDDMPEDEPAEDSEDFGDEDKQ